MCPSNMQRDTERRAEANYNHETYQSPLETKARGCMNQSFVNKVLGLFGDY